MTNIQIPPGLIDENIELFSANGKMMATHSGSVKSIFELPTDFINILNTEMHSAPSIIKALKMGGYVSHKSKLEKFAECRFGGFDLLADFKDGKLSDVEYHDCGFRGNCLMEGIVCKFFKVQDQILTPFEIKMIQLLATEDTLPVIAEKLQVCMTTFEVKKHWLYEKLGVLSRARLVSLCYDLQILKMKLCT